jgi:hypothetical protein
MIGGGQEGLTGTYRKYGGHHYMGELYALWNSTTNRYIELLIAEPQVTETKAPIETES